MINGLGGFIGQLQSAVSGAADAVEAQAPVELKPQVEQAGDQFQQLLSNPLLLNQLGVPTPVALPRLETAAAVQQAYAQGASRDLTSPKTLEKLNKELGDKGPVTRADVEKVIQNTDVKMLSADDYRTLKMATGVEGASFSNPATAIDADSRAAIGEKGPYNLAKIRNRGQEPSAEQIAAAKQELEKIDPSLFKKGSRDVIYVNQKHVNGVADPRLTKVAAHEYLHLVMHKKGVEGEAVQHDIIGKFGWNQVPGPGGANRNWATPPGKGLPPD